MCTERLDGWAFALVEQAHLDERAIGDATNDTAKGIDFTHQMPFGRPANRRVAREMADFVEVNGKKDGTGAHAGRRSRCFAAGMASTDDGNVICRVMNEGVHVCPLLPGTHDDSSCTNQCNCNGSLYHCMV